MNLNRFGKLVLAGFFVSAVGAMEPQTVLQLDFSKPQQVQGYFGTKNYQLVKTEQGTALRIENPEAKSVYIAVQLSPTQFSGCRLRLSATIAGREISAKPKSWNGGKLQICATAKGGKPQWFDVEIPDGTFAARPFEVTAQLPGNLEKLSFIIGLEDCSGQLDYSNLALTVLDAPPGWKFPETGPIPPETQALLNLPLEKSDADKVWPEGGFRGVTYPAWNGTYPSEEQFRQLKKWNVNAVRLWLEPDKDTPWAKDPDALPIPPDDPMAPFRKNLLGLQTALALGQKYQIYIIPVAGGSLWRGSDDLIAKSSVDKNDPAQVALQEKCWNRFVEALGDLWGHVAQKYGDHPWLLSYDLLNEPHTPREVKLQDQLFRTLIDRVRAVDTNTWLTLEPGPWALPDQAFENREALTGEKLVYSFHFYYPHSYTHQNIHSYQGETFYPKPYPGVLRLFDTPPDSYWDKAALEKSMANAIEFQRKYGVKLWIGEFGVARWAPGAERWLADVIDLFEKYDWPWTLHCYGNWWNGWNHTFDADDPQSAIGDGGKVTPCLKVLMEGWSRNPAAK